MPVSLGSNIASLVAQRRLSESTSLLGRTFERLSSGQRINRASDDAAGLAIADSLRAGSRVFNQGVRNLNDGISLFNIADSAIENLSSIMVRMEELATQAANGTYGNQQRKAIDLEAQALSKEYFRISKSTEFNGQRILTGELDAINLQGGAGTSAVLSGGVGGAIGTGAFASAGSLTTGSLPISVVSGDFNGDGIIDLANTDYSAHSISVFLGLGNGTFGSRTSYATGTNPQAITAGDFNGDGVTDLVTTDFAADALSVFMGNGNGTFSQRTSYAAGNGPVLITPGDFNGDGATDLASVNFFDGTLNVFMGNGAGSFGARTSYSFAANLRSVAAADFNGDGIQDLVTADYGPDTLSVLLGTGSGTFGPRTSFATGVNPYSVATGDLNGDGHLDLVSANYGTSSLSVLLGSGVGTFGAPTSFAVGSGPRWVTTGDFNGDGLLDLASAEQGGTFSVLLGNGAGSFGTRVSHLASGTARSIIAADLNGDGVTDLAGASGANSINVLFGSSKDGVAPLLPFSLKTMADARQALPVFKQKRDQLAAQRGEIGAFQSRIGVAVNVLQVSSENFRAAESRIRDADMADESSKLLRLNILQQAASAVLAQANQQPALAISLLSP